MLRSILNGSIVMSLCVVLFIAGCGPQADLSLKFAPSDVTTYTVVSRNDTTFKFDMPSSKNFKEDVSQKLLSVTFDQEIQSVNEAGVATAKITIKDIIFKDIDKGNVKFDYDSTKKANEPLGKLLSKSYTITIDPKGAVAVLDASAARSAIKSGVAASKARGILADKSIINRHEVVTLAKLDDTNVTVGNTWSVKEKPAYKLLMPRTFEKVYKLDQIRTDGDKSVAVVSMNATPAGANGQGDFNPAMLMFSSMMDVDESYEGSMELDVNTGTLLNLDETLNVQYVATDPKENSEPDVLIITLVYSHTAQIVD